MAREKKGVREFGGKKEMGRGPMNCLDLSVSMALLGPQVYVDILIQVIQKETII